MESKDWLVRAAAEMALLEILEKKKRI